MQGYKLTYHVDMVFCIDATGSMRHVLDLVKQNAMNLYRDIAAEMEKKHKVIDRMRVRVIAFRDYVADGEDAMLSSEFFNLPEEAQVFHDCVDGIQAKGGGDIPEDGLEALAYAIRYAKEHKTGSILVCLSGRGDKDIDYVYENYGCGEKFNIK